MTPPAQPLDAAAVEAAKRCGGVLTRHSIFLSDHNERVADFARIITDAYADWMKLADVVMRPYSDGEWWDASIAIDNLLNERKASAEQSARLTAERVVREKLVALVKKLWMPQLPDEDKESISATLAAAAELGKQDA